MTTHPSPTSPRQPRNQGSSKESSLWSVWDVVASASSHGSVLWWSLPTNTRSWSRRTSDHSGKKMRSLGTSETSSWSGTGTNIRRATMCSSGLWSLSSSGGSAGSCWETSSWLGFKWPRHLSSSYRSITSRQEITVGHHGSHLRTSVISHGWLGWLLTSNTACC